VPDLGRGLRLTKSPISQTVDRIIFLSIAMSRASKVFLSSSIVLSAVTVWGVHYLQQRESDTMYQGVLRDEERVRDKALALLSLSSPSPSPSLSPTSTPPSSSPKVYSAPLNTPSAPIQQPAPVIDEDCPTCITSPPPQLVEAQSAGERARDREDRRVEYEVQKDLGHRLEREQGVEETREV
ncbi:MAG: hypothetical protein TREMPRED_001329, partial [Tremellales sp. Tagirdzhanova-0007]